VLHRVVVCRTLLAVLAGAVVGAGCKPDSDGSPVDGQPNGVASSSGGNGAAADGGAPSPTGGGPSTPRDGGTEPQPSEGGAASECCESPGGPGCRSAAIDECVCEIWQQADCCSGEWNEFCQITASEKCKGPAVCARDGGTAAVRGACCAAHEGSGCDDPDVEACVCDLLPDCCSGNWDFLCAQIVAEKRCEPGVRECVCEEWEQMTCCEEQWTAFCGITAEAKCGASPRCGE
jgi:hypothetical protein